MGQVVRVEFLSCSQRSRTSRAVHSTAGKADEGSLERTADSSPLWLQPAFLSVRRVLVFQYSSTRARFPIDGHPRGDSRRTRWTIPIFLVALQKRGNSPLRGRTYPSWPYRRWIRSLKGPPQQTRGWQLQNHSQRKI